MKFTEEALSKISVAENYIKYFPGVKIFHPCCVMIRYHFSSGVYMQNNRKVGDAQETRAIFELEKLGYKILQKNFRCRMGEIDLIALHRGYLVFVEVKYRKNTRAGSAAEAVNWKKQQVISRVADYYIRTHCSRFPPLIRLRPTL